MAKGFAEVNGQRLYYRVQGKGKPLVLIAGLGGDTTEWMYQLPVFRKHFEVVVFDNRDVGRSSLAEGPYSITDMAEDTAGLLDTLGIEKAHILGFSMGSMIAQELAMRHPQKVDKLVLLCAAARAKNTFIVRTLELWKWIRQNDSDNEFFPIESIKLGMTPDYFKDLKKAESTLSLLRKPKFPMKTEAFERQADAVSGFDVLKKLNGVNKPTLVLTGDWDIITPVWVGKELAEAISGAEFKILEGGGHGCLWEIADKVNRAVLEFLA